MKVQAYGMRLRGFSPGCQPKEGYFDRKESNKSETGYHDIIYYKRVLTDREMYDYELDYLGEVDV